MDSWKKLIKKVSVDNISLTLPDQSSLLLNVQFQKISIPTPRKVNGSSEGLGGLKSENFKRKVYIGLDWNFQRGGGGGGVFKPKNLPLEGYGYFLEQHNLIIVTN